jgi:uncharacterized membrane protein YkoI
MLWTPALAAERAAEHACLTAEQAREKIALHKLAEPFRLMLAMAKRFQGDAIGVKLCRRKDEFIYEISLLRRDGRVIHVVMNAASGQFMHATNIK